MPARRPPRPTFSANVRAFVHAYRSYRRNKPGLEVMAQATKIAGSPIADAEAVEEIVRVVAQHPPRAVGRALAMSSTSLTVDGDRAHRLLRAALDGSPVPPVDAGKAEQIAEIERWRRLPLREAFQQLAALVPELEPIGAEAEAWAAVHTDADDTAHLRPFLRLTRRIDHLLQFGRESSPDLVVRSGLGRSIAVTYVRVALGDHDRGGADTSSAEISQKPSTGTIVFGPRPA